MESYIHTHVVCALTVLLSYIALASSSETRLSATSPLNPVEEGGILSLHCQVWALQGLHEVTITRKVDRFVDRLSMDDIVLAESDNIFLAVRQLNDGSSVYFLTIMDAAINDKGTYTCKIVNKEDNSIVSSESVEFGITHFPGDSDPICSPNEPLSVMEGDEIELMCSSQKANPAVLFSWIRSGKELNAMETEEIDGRLYSTLRYRPSLKDEGVIFQCKITSPAFPQSVQTCHIGPLRVQRNPNSVVTDAVAIVTPRNDIATLPNGMLSPNDHTTWSASECRKHCSSSTSILYWIITTVVAGIIALIFFIMGLVLLIRYHRINHLTPVRSPYGSVLHYPKDSIYSELEIRRNDNKVYMTLEKNNKGLQKMQLSGVNPEMGHYDTDPKY